VSPAGSKLAHLLSTACQSADNKTKLTKTAEQQTYTPGVTTQLARILACLPATQQQNDGHQRIAGNSAHAQLMHYSTCTEGCIVQACKHHHLILSIITVSLI